jgi:hypothetical protein
MLDLLSKQIERVDIELTPEKAAVYLKFNTYKAQRALRLPYVEELAGKMLGGLFRGGEIAFAVLKEGAVVLLINGQHVCSAVILSGVTVICVLFRYRLEDELEVSEAFRQFEVLPRSIKDMVRVEAHALSVWWPDWVSNLIVSAAGVKVTGHKRLGPPSAVTTPGARTWQTRDEKVALLGKHLEVGAFIANILTSNGTLSGDGCRHLRRQPIALIMMKTWEVDPDAAEIFWSRVRDGESLMRTMPEMRLREFLVGVRTGKHRGYAGVKPSLHEYAYRCAFAWNNFRSGKLTQMPYSEKRRIPKVR